MALKIALIISIGLASVISHVVNKRQIQISSVSVSLNESITDEGRLTNAIQELALSISAIQWEKGQTGNVVQSPLSIAALLSLLLLGSRGESHLELKRGLNYPNDIQDSVVHATFRKVLDSLEKNVDGVEISMSTRLFLQEKLSVLSQFTDIAEHSYKSKVEGLDFARSPTNALKHINDWVSATTKGKITDLITVPFSPDTKFVAANAIYFNGEWENAFPERFTEDGTFDTGERNITIPMMTNLITVPYLNGEQLGFDIIALPYRGNKYSMYILTPRGSPGIRALQRMEYNLDSNVLNTLISRMIPKKVAVKIPRMKLSQKLYLKDDLKTIEIHKIFNPAKADFGRLTTESGIFVSDIVHEAILEITETGTVAAAASAATFDRMGGNEVFQLNRPSLLFIRDNTNGLTLFWARVIEPEPLIA